MKAGGKLRLKVWLAVGSVVCAGIAAFALFDAGIWRFNYPSRDRFPIQGIDVSRHQGTIDWPAVAATREVQFAYIKATEGGDFRDAAFAENWAKSKQAGIARGAYHFFTFCRPGAEQARNFLAVVPAEPGTLPVAVDLEFGGNCSARPTLKALLAELNDFLGEIRKVHLRTPFFYVTSEFYDRYVKGNIKQFPAHHLWLRNIYSEPTQQGCARWTLWQFAHRGRLDGIAGPVDLNVFCGDQAAFASLIASVSATH
ncbi:MAG: GH25 family lysozyme [Candidatus Eiseniibacteriota bacterium]